MPITAVRYHEICVGHRVVGHEGKCRFLHGHNYRFTMHLRGLEGAELDHIGRVIDFGEIKRLLCEWLEDHWDHKFLVYREDSLMLALSRGLHSKEAVATASQEERDNFFHSLVPVEFNTTAENIADHFLREVAPKVLAGYNVEMFRVDVNETTKCVATAEL